MNQMSKKDQPATLGDLAALEQKIGNALRTFHAWVELRETENKDLIPKAADLYEQVLEDISDLEQAPWRIR